MYNSNDRKFSVAYRCFSMSIKFEAGRKEVDNGGKAIFPPSALDRLTRLNVQYPMMFRLENKKESRTSHCGVLEFVAEEGRAYLPHWMMKNLNLTEGSIVQVDNVSLDVASFAKFEPQSVDFLDITDPKSVLEYSLRSFACLTSGDTIAIDYNDRTYEIKVLETRPKDAVCIVECDMSVDFAPPVGYVEERKQKLNHDDDDDDGEKVDLSKYAVKKFKPFSGQGCRLDGKVKLVGSSEEKQEIPRGVPNYGYRVGKLTFIRSTKKVSGPESEKKDGDEFKSFSGQGHSLRK